MPTEREVAWAAGLFEGEGTMTLNGVSRSPRVKLSMVDRDIVQRFHRIVGVGQTCEWNDGKNQPQLCWYSGAKNSVRIVIEMFLPYFGVRRKQRAAQVLARAMDTPFEGWDAPRDGELEALR
jgi:hypothetical protein